MERLILCFLVIFVDAKMDACNSATSCGECIRIPDCAWCSMTDFSHHPDNASSANLVRCNARGKRAIVNCHPAFVVDSQSDFSVIGDEALTTAKGVEDPIQLRPQLVSLRNMRVGQVYNFSMQFKQAKDYPVDLYFLMDLSHSMKDDVVQLETLGEELARTMRNITRYFKLGFGSFVDKNTMPFAQLPRTSTASETYSFWNQMKLSAESQKFTEKVKNARIITTIDLPEGGFDALVQAIVCKDQIGWRERARHIIVFATDDYSHLAGDGKIGGVIKPNDGLCHLNANGMYTKALEQDYPSLGHISRLAKDYSMNLIFAVTYLMHPTYVEFTKLIEGSSAGKLEYNSANIVTLVRDQYQLITSSVEMKDTAVGGVKIRYYTSCLGDLMQKNRKCDGLRVGSLVDFTVSVEITECPSKRSDQNQVIQIYPVGLNETLLLRLNIVCDCDCEKQPQPEADKVSPECSGGGQLQCGICKCREGRAGINCECAVDDVATSSEKDCRSVNSSSSSPTTKVCNGRGNCVCGKCECHKRTNADEIIGGKYCECDNFSCDRLDNKFCSGNGVCSCGQCLCHDGWKGDACQCKNSFQSCIPIGGGDVCSGNGNCECGSCQCFENAKGRYCQDCPTCPSKCHEFEDCVQCKLFQTGRLTKISGDCDRLCSYAITRHENVVVEQTSERECFYVDVDNCKVRFVYGFGENGEARVRVAEQKTCPQPLPVQAIGFGLMGTLVAAGLIMLLIWRLLTFLYDRKEFARFVDESQNAKWNAENNPLYVEASTTFKNPTFDTVN